MCVFLWRSFIKRQLNFYGRSAVLLILLVRFSLLTEAKQSRIRYQLTNAEETLRFFSSVSNAAITDIQSHRFTLYSKGVISWQLYHMYFSFMDIYWQFLIKEVKLKWPQLCLISSKNCDARLKMYHSLNMDSRNAIFEVKKLCMN